jgi:hypothetical protein
LIFEFLQFLKFISLKDCYNSLHCILLIVIVDYSMCFYSSIVYLLCLWNYNWDLGILIFSNHFLLKIPCHHWLINFFVDLKTTNFPNRKIPSERVMSWSINYCLDLFIVSLSKDFLLIFEQISVWFHLMKDPNVLIFSMSTMRVCQHFHF